MFAAITFDIDSCVVEIYTKPKFLFFIASKSLWRKTALLEYNGI